MQDNKHASYLSVAPQRTTRACPPLDPCLFKRHAVLMRALFRHYCTALSVKVARLELNQTAICLARQRVPGPQLLAAS